MKILKNNYGKEIQDKPIYTVCNNCFSELEVTDEDIKIGWLGEAYVTCPCCGKETTIDDETKGITLTADNINFPTHFHRVNKDLDAKEVSNEEIIRDIKKGIQYFRENKDEYVWYISYGDLFLIIFRYLEDDEYFILTTKDYYETWLSFDKNDF